MRLVLSRQARADLAEIRRFLEQDSPRAAAATLGRLNTVVQQLVSGELQGPVVPLTDGRRVQVWPVPPYRIYYERTPSLTRVVRV